MDVGPHRITAATLGFALMLTLAPSISPASAGPAQTSQTPSSRDAQTGDAQNRQGQKTEPASTTQVQAQTPKAVRPAPQPDVDKLPISLDRIREQLSHEPAFSLNLLRALDIPVFRVEQRSDLVFRPDPNYWKDNDVGADVRPRVNQWHYDFMKMTNPDVPQGYGPGGGVDVLPAIQSVFSSIRHGSQNRQRAQVRQQIRDELRQINEQRRAAGLPPLDDAPVSSDDDGNGNGDASGNDRSSSSTSKPQRPAPSTTVVPRPPQ
jgi:hypothetical protein